MSNHTIRNEPRFTNLQPGEPVIIDALSETKRQRARLTCARNATSHAELWEWLLMLGLDT